MIILKTDSLHQDSQRTYLPAESPSDSTRITKLPFSKNFKESKMNAESTRERKLSHGFMTAWSNISNIQSTRPPKKLLYYSTDDI
jgi:hypothetical protein